jgi:hypothetical protein
MEEAGRPSILSKAVAVSVVQGVEQAQAISWERAARERVGYLLLRNQAMAASRSNQPRGPSGTGKPGGGSSSQRGSGSRQRKLV